MKQALVFFGVIMFTVSAAQKNQNDSIFNQELAEVTIVGGKSKSMPGSGEYIGNVKLNKLNQTNINNVLRVIPGVNVRDEEGFGLRPNIGLRGTSVNRSSKITIMEDGVLVAPAPYADPSAYYFPTFSRMQGVEVLKGSSQLKYGPYTIGGALNLISTAIPDKFKAFAQLSYGSFNTNQQRVWLGSTSKNFDYLVEVNRIASNGFKQLDNGDNTGFDRRDIMAKVRWHRTTNVKVPQDVTIKFVANSEDANETYLGLTLSDYETNHLKRYAGTQKDILNLNHQLFTINHNIIPFKGLIIQTTAYKTRTFRDWARASSFGGVSIANILNSPETNVAAYNIMNGKANGAVVYQGAARTFNTQGIQSNLTYNFETTTFKHKFQLGIRVHEDEADRLGARSTYTMNNGIMDLTVAGVNGNSENQIRQANSTAGFLVYEVKYKDLTVTTGVRSEKISLNLYNYGTADVNRSGAALLKANNNVSVFLPGIGFNYDLNTNSNVFVGIHKGFSPPGVPSTTNIVQIMPEISVNYELGYRFKKNNLNAHVTFFANNYQNILGSDNLSGGGAGTGDMFNAGKALIKGVEFAAQYDLLGNTNAPKKLKLPVGISYTYTSATFSQTFINGGGDWGAGLITKGDAIPFITPHLLTATLGVEGTKFTVNLLARYTGVTAIKPNQTTIITPSANTKYTDINALNSFLIIDLSANYLMSKNVTIFSTINNLTNNKAIVANLPQGYRPNMPFSLLVGCKLYL